MAKNNGTQVIFSIRVYLLNPDRSIKETKTIDVPENEEAKAFNELPARIKKIHNGKWIYSGYFRIKKG